MPLPMPPDMEFVDAPAFDERAELERLRALKAAQTDERAELEELRALKAEQSSGTVGGGLVGSLGQGLTFGFGDELQAGLFAAPRALGNLIAGKEDASLGGAYDELLQGARSDLEAAREQYPVTSTGLEVAGALGTGVLGAGTKLGRFVTRKAAQGLTPTAATATGRLAGRAGAGAAIGGAGGAAYGFGTGEGAEGRLQSAQDVGLAGATIGGGLPIAGAGLGVAGKAVTPKIDEGLREVGKLAQKYNIPLSLEQLSGSRALKNIQKVSQELPLSGQAAFRDKQLSAWNKAVINTFGENADKFTPELADKAFARLGKQFNSLGKGKIINVGNLAANIDSNVIRAGRELGASKDAIEGVQEYLKRAVLPNIQDGSIKGETLNKIRAEINALARKSTNIDSKTLYRDLENEVVDALVEGSGKAAKAFSRTKEQYKNLLATEPLFTKEKGGVVSPSLLTNRVNKIYKRAATRGKAGELGDLARIGRSILGEAGGSDTTQKMAYLAAATTGGINPATIPLMAGGAAVNRAFQSFLNRNQGLINRLLNNDAAAVKEVMKRKPAEAKMILEGVKQLKAGVK